MVAGLLAGLLGIGGGAIIVPVLAIVFEHQAIASGVLMQAAIGTSLATIVFTALSSIRAHHARKAIDWRVFRRLTPGVIAGALAGAAIAHLLPGALLKTLFGIFLLFIAAQMARPHMAPVTPSNAAPSWMFAAGGVIGFLSALFGIGGATITVPFLAWYGLSPVQGVATAAAVGLPIALAGTLGYVVTGWHVPGLPPWSAGYVVLPAFGGIVVASVLFAPLGARLAHRLRPLMLRRIFALLLVVFGLRLLFG